MNEVILNENNELALQVVERIAQAEKIIQEMKKVQDDYREQLAKIMGDRSIKDIENEMFKVTYFPETEKPSLDSVKLKENYEEVYLSCLKKTKTKAFVKITLK